jgi:acyl-CoA thioester hydrolase
VIVIRRKKGAYFQPGEGAPAPLVVSLKRRVNFSEVDVLGIAWYGRYPAFFEEGSAELGRLCGLSYKDFADANLRAPMVQFHIDYHQPLVLDEEFTVKVSAIWSEGARMNTEYAAIKGDGSLAATAYSVQMLIDGGSGETCLTSPQLLERCRRRWKAGELSWLQ